MSVFLYSNLITSSHIYTSSEQVIFSQVVKQIGYMKNIFYSQFDFIRLLTLLALLSVFKRQIICHIYLFLFFVGKNTFV